MADSLKMGNLSLNESQHAPAAPPSNGRAAYIPPHLRQRTMGANVDGAAASPPGPAPGAGAWNGPRYVFRDPSQISICLYVFILADLGVLLAETLLAVATGLMPMPLTSALVVPTSPMVTSAGLPRKLNVGPLTHMLTDTQDTEAPTAVLMVLPKALETASGATASTSPVPQTPA